VRTVRVLASAILGLGLTTACSQPAPFKPVTTVKELMKATIEPTAEVVFDAAVWENGVSVGAPKTDDEWNAVRNNALTLAESGNLLMMAPRARDEQGWMTRSQELIDAGVGAAKAAESKNLDAVFAAGGKIYLACTGCHQQYMTNAQQGAR
jgi:cytochrome c556